MDVPLTEMLDMTWEDVKQAKSLYLPDEDVKLNGTVQTQLEQEFNRRGGRRLPCAANGKLQKTHGRAMSR